MLEEFVKRFEKLGYKEQTEIQKAVYQPMIDGGEDIVGLSPTGSGKTVAFLMPILANIMAGEGTQALIVEPSQELAMQVTSIIRDWAGPFKVKILPLIGGANVKRQQEQLKKRPEIVVGTPGRILGLLDERKLKVNHVDTVVIDEADDLLQDDSLEKARQIVAAVPRDAQVAYFSATDNEVLYNLEEVMGKPARIIDVRDLDKSRGVVKHGQFQVSRGKRNDVLNRLTKLTNFKALVFFNQQTELNRAFNYFKHQGYAPVEKLSGEENKMQREKALRNFRKGQTKLLLTTDVAARGLDIPKLPAVVNYDLPKEANTYIHRVGRTGRMGEPGLVINFGDDHDLRDLKKLLRDEEYDLQPLYYFRGKLVDHVDQADIDQAKADELAKQKVVPEVKGTKPSVKKARIRKVQAVVETPKKPRKKNRKRNQKNKGYHKK
ncbi:DEAD/DEAH box helicase [Fructilactobacillus sanfranciscensis]|uniref:DEAD/DEAH box helicase n=1 Tax=Fructilactobacillus sanfranciscensis TaxID=1625 RepID=UPI00111A9B95|nr:DEAD/DEAH box helicase [Fructilactobacillus sanfranciscensis]MVF16224.1 DEAD/DEAH box helicase [Fructilactobacillus sanfranciscensis]TNK97330.1 helicase [Fructilactobacillus sanfranciscensis]TNL01508.1 ATP-dependent helicase [Fructilactobacillus sanfranciscensis]